MVGAVPSACDRRSTARGLPLGWPAMPRSPWPPDPPTQMPPARTVAVPGRGEFFLRDTGGDGPAVMLLHGWMATADLNWHGAYGDLSDAGYRVLAIDHRGHGRGLRPLVPFRLSDCAGDAAAVLHELELAPAIVVGYSMGGAIAQLVAHEHPDAVRGLILSGTAQHWQDAETPPRVADDGRAGADAVRGPPVDLALGLSARRARGVAADGVAAVGDAAPPGPRSRRGRAGARPLRLPSMAVVCQGPERRGPHFTRHGGRAATSSASSPPPSGHRYSRLRSPTCRSRPGPSATTPYCSRPSRP